ncbi:MAG: nucleotide exchange factor GrpE [Anaerolineae bacterium]|nr:MAG: nucleotide exchange factor GrpE [Anaerolineae bacterium]
MSEEQDTPTPEDEAAATAEADPAMDELDDLMTQLETARAEAAANLEGWQRAQAEFVNYKKRQEQQRAQTYDDTVARVAKRYLDVLDDLERAMGNRPAEGEGAEWAQGIELVTRKLVNILDSEGIKVMDPLGQPFDPNLHEAISQDESDGHESGTILEVLQKGYLLGERVIRPALVRVAA